MIDQIPNWFNNAVVSGVMIMCEARLKFRPSDSDQTTAAKTMINLMWCWPINWDQERDEWRLNKMFINAASGFTEWPCPGQLRPALPPREPLPALTAPRSFPNHVFRSMEEYEQAVLTDGVIKNEKL